MKKDKQIIKELPEETYQLYDKIVAKYIGHLVDYYNKDEEISILKVNLKDKRDLFGLEMIAILHQFYGKKINVGGGLINFLKIKKYFKKEIKTFFLNKKEEQKVDICIFRKIEDYIINDFEKEQILVTGQTFENIYEAYYERR